MSSEKECSCLGKHTGKCQSQFSEVPGQGDIPWFAKLQYSEIRNLEGRVLTFIEATCTDREQRESQKSMMRNLLWSWADSLMIKSAPEMPTGIPINEKD